MFCKNKKAEEGDSETTMLSVCRGRLFLLATRTEPMSAGEHLRIRYDAAIAVKHTFNCHEMLIMYLVFITSMQVIVLCAQVKYFLRRHRV